MKHNKIYIVIEKEGKLWYNNLISQYTGGLSK